MKQEIADKNNTIALLKSQEITHKYEISNLKNTITDLQKDLTKRFENQFHNEINNLGSLNKVS